MNSGPSRQRLALIAGPTASGKSALALILAERTGGVVVNADSMQVYRDLRVLTARPSEAEEARAPHRLFGHLDAAIACSAADWAADARAAIADAHDAGRLPILVGGTGLYLRTLLDGIAPVPPVAPPVRAEVRAMPLPEAYARLEQVDPAAAARLHPNDASRIARALEVALSSGRPLADWQARREGGIGDAVDLRAALLLPDRGTLHARIDARAEAMLAGGAVEEAAALAARGLSPDLPAMRAIGVRALAEFAAGRLSRTAARDALATETRQYAKRQCTWFRHQPPSHWRRLEFYDDPRVLKEILLFLA